MKSALCRYKNQQSSAEEGYIHSTHQIISQNNHADTAHQQFSTAISFHQHKSHTLYTVYHHSFNSLQQWMFPCTIRNINTAMVRITSTHANPIC